MSRLLLMLARAIRLRCPRCGGTGLFESWLRPKKACPTCGQPIERSEDGYYLGSLLVNLIVAELVPIAAIVGVLIATLPHPPWNLLMFGGAALAAVSPFAFYPVAKLVWLAVDQFIQPTMDRTASAPPDDRG